MISTNMLSESRLIKEGKMPRTKAPKSQHFVTSRVLQPKCSEETHTKKNNEATECAKRMKEAKEKLQEQIAKRCRLSLLKASTSESSQK